MNAPSGPTVHEATGNGAVICDLNKGISGTGIADESVKRRMAQEDGSRSGTVLAERAFVRDIRGNGKVSGGDARNRG